MNINWRTLSLIFVMVSSLALCATTFARQESEQKDVQQFSRHLETLIPELLEQYQIAGSAVGLIEDGRIVYVKGFGFADKRLKIPVTARTIFNIGSIHWLQAYAQATQESRQRIVAFIESASMPNP